MEREIRTIKDFSAVTFEVSCEDQGLGTLVTVWSKRG